jgi:hypothetical protein
VGTDAAFVTDAPITDGKVDKTTTLGGSEESTTRVIGYFAGTSAYGTVYYVMPGVCDSTQWTWKATKTAGPDALSSRQQPVPSVPSSGGETSQSTAASEPDTSGGADDGGASISGGTWSASVPPGWSIAPAQQGDDADLLASDRASAISVSAGQPVQSTDTADSLGAAAMASLQSNGYTEIQQPKTGTWSGQPAFALTAGNGSTGTDVEVVGAIFDDREVVITYAVRGSITANSQAASTLQELESTWHWNK